MKSIAPSSKRSCRISHKTTAAFRRWDGQPRVLPTEREAFEHHLQSDGIPAYRLPPATAPDACFPVDYVVAFTGDASARGCDLASNLVQRQALEAARDTGRVTLTAPIPSKQQTAVRIEFLAFLPIYRNNAPQESVEQRRAALQGFLVATFVADDFVQSALHGIDLSLVHFVLTDRTVDTNGGQQLYACRPGDRVCDTPDDPATASANARDAHMLRVERSFPVGGRMWSVTCYAESSQWVAAASLYADVLFLEGVSLTVVGVLFHLSLVRRRRRVECLVRHRTEELTQANEALRNEMIQREEAERRVERSLSLQTRLNTLFQMELPSSGDLDQKLRMIADAVVEAFDADFCRIWVTQPGDLCESGCIHARVTDGPHVCRHRERCLRLAASSGRYTHTDGAMHSRVPFGCYKIGRVASGLEPKFLTNDVINDPRVHDHAWARTHGLVSFGGYRLLSADGTPIGVLALFAKHPISADEDAALQSLATSTSHVIQTMQAEAALRSNLEHLDELVARRTSELAAANSELQGEITERTRAEQALREAKEAADLANASLRETVAELEAFNRLAVGRELRMVELKTEVNQLCNTVGARSKVRDNR